MTFGLSIHNTYGNILLDADSIVYQVEQEGIINSRTSFDAATIPDSWIMGDKILFIRPPNNTIQFALSKVDLIPPTNWFLWADSVASFEYKLVSLAKDVTSKIHGWGIAVFNDLGQRVYAVSDESLKVASVIYFPASGTSNLNISLPQTTKNKFISINGSYVFQYASTTTKAASFKLASEFSLIITSNMATSEYTRTAMVGYF